MFRHHCYAFELYIFMFRKILQCYMFSVVQHYASFFLVTSFCIVKPCSRISTSRVIAHNFYKLKTHTFFSPKYTSWNSCTYLQLFSILSSIPYYLYVKYNMPCPLFTINLFKITPFILFWHESNYINLNFEHFFVFLNTLNVI